mmetsp:Transcript_27485/g.81927  ORF Transcript_27485/g.81927 Transcript_27485/m.81927 type:complete len:219 (-) Transcript_27485:540-1196(-)
MSCAERPIHRGTSRGSLPCGVKPPAGAAGIGFSGTADPLALQPAVCSGALSSCSGSATLMGYRRAAARARGGVLARLTSGTAEPPSARLPVMMLDCSHSARKSGCTDSMLASMSVLAASARDSASLAACSRFFHLFPRPSAHRAGSALWAMHMHSSSPPACFRASPTSGNSAQDGSWMSTTASADSPARSRRIAWEELSKPCRALLYDSAGPSSGKPC